MNFNALLAQANKNAENAKKVLQLKDVDKKKPSASEQPNKKESTEEFIRKRAEEARLRAKQEAKELLELRRKKLEGSSQNQQPQTQTTVKSTNEKKSDKPSNLTNDQKTPTKTTTTKNTALKTTPIKRTPTKATFKIPRLTKANGKSEVNNNKPTNSSTSLATGNKSQPKTSLTVSRPSYTEILKLAEDKHKAKLKEFYSKHPTKINNSSSRSSSRSSSCSSIPNKNIETASIKTPINKQQQQPIQKQQQQQLVQKQQQRQNPPKQRQLQEKTQQLQNQPQQQQKPQQRLSQPQPQQRQDLNSNNNRILKAKSDANLNKTTENVNKRYLPGDIRFTKTTNGSTQSLNINTSKQIQNTNQNIQKPKIQSTSTLSIQQKPQQLQKKPTNLNVKSQNQSKIEQNQKPVTKPPPQQQQQQQKQQQQPIKKPISNGNSNTTTITNSKSVCISGASAWDRIVSDVKKKPVASKTDKSKSLKRGYESNLNDDYDNDDDEYDSEMDDFIDDDDDDKNDYSEHIRRIFKYDPKRYKHLDNDDDLDYMESSYHQILKEERESAKAGYLEDLEDMKLEEEEKKRKMHKTKKLKTN